MFQVYRRCEGDPNFYAINTDGTFGFANDEVKAKEFATHSGLSAAAMLAVEFAAAAGRPFVDGERLLVRNVDGGIGVFAVRLSNPTVDRAEWA